MHFCMDELRSIAHIGALLPQIVAALFWVVGKVWSQAADESTSREGANMRKQDDRLEFRLS